ncbi:hypothetical protein MSUIS_04970 [Mycoplasma suis KI3806]|uniref:Uncharacterized protein n=1 Tax=Mycoplasma suis (strain KI_3806) TaxID=708248 RepID=F0V1Q9_MYCS3|nr:hypothetical protein [Mycoplasma suis]CBZ40590.1 hypothetical protein MSUIS_04970 [Mycoplasma suis KI3806]
MIKKLIVSFAGVGGVFSASAFSHLNSLFFSSTFDEQFKSRNNKDFGHSGGALSNFSLPHKVSINEGFSPRKAKSSLNPHYFGEWSSQSEGGIYSIYLVDKEGLFKRNKS